SWQAGGGYGDPLLRDPAAVARDVARGAVSREAAAGVYGVELGPGDDVDVASTSTLRAAMRRERLARSRPPTAGGALVLAGRGQHRYGDVLLADLEASRIACAHCGETLGAAGEDLRPRLREIEAPLASAGAVRGEDYDEGRFRLRELCCPHCATLIDVQVALDGAPPPALRFEFANV
ncbi:MAG: hypothetical protein KJ018_18940, partial [Burkholderiales bacterium]|nr:hypothetical protein [Burkholderiales bacterium]